MTSGSPMVDQVMDYAIIRLSPDGTIESWNLGAERLKGYARHEALGQNFAMFYRAEDRAAGLPRASLAEARADGRCEHTGWRVRKDGTEFWGDVVITALHDGDVFTGYVKVTRDLTDRKELETAQDTFYDAFDHDFRLPITAIKGLTELIREAGPEDREQFLDRVDANADRVLRMVEGLVAYARVRSGLIPITLRPVDLRTAARDAIANVGNEATSEPTTAVMVLADSRALERVIANVVNNAIKYSPLDSPITLTATTEDGLGVLRVVDQGRGIDQGDLDLVFAEFERGRMPRDEFGTGLGLTSARQLLGLQGGTIAIASEVGTGTTVTIRLPLAAQNRPPARKAG
ncbi:MAG: hybrid sensor histidine kinase/response regulator [Marmoricola sp.]|nr:hybrid sensor histidine kinase/response regulator [Marmoricola sp.]